MSAENIVKSIVEELEHMIETKTIIGEPITAAGKTVIPITKVSFGFGGAGGLCGAGGADKGSGGGGAGAKVEPVAFLVISEDDVKLISIGGKDDVVTTILGAVPQVLEKVASLRKKKGAKESTSEEIPDECCVVDDTEAPIIE